MSGTSWVKFYPSDWLAGTRGLSAIETGIYITLIMMMYERGEPVADDRKRLARLCGTSSSVFSKAVDALIEDGKIIAVDSGLWNLRVEKEQKNREQLSDLQSKNARARWEKDKEKQRTEDAVAMPSQCLPDTRYQIPESKNRGSPDGEPMSTSVDLLGEQPTPKNVKRETIREILTAVLDGERADALIAHRKKIRSALTEYSAGLLVKKLKKYHDPNSAADEMIVRGWKGFEPEWMENRNGHKPDFPNGHATGVLEGARRASLLAEEVDRRRAEQMGGGGGGSDGSEAGARRGDDVDAPRIIEGFGRRAE